jgi:hypothetical protein
MGFEGCTARHQPTARFQVELLFLHNGWQAPGRSAMRPESWVREQVRSRSGDPLPHLRLGKYVRFLWGSSELDAWIQRRMISGSNRKAVRALGKENQ